MKRYWLLSLTTLIITCCWASLAFAAEAKTAAVNHTAWVAAISAALTIAIAVYGGVMAQSKATVAALEGIARNPGARPQIFVPMILGLVLIESLVIYALVVALILTGKV
jgi:F-type H+-transporting ATPase subunit c